MHEPWSISMDTESPGAIPYFNWDTPVSNAELRRRLREADEDERLVWIARIMREARYDDVWRYLSLRRDVLPSWERLRRILGRRRAFWEFLLGEWRRAGLVE
jgi:hypothetical protein